MSVTNACVSALLRSPLHRLLSSSTGLVRYRGRRTGREIVTPTQYARVGNDLVILVGRPDAKRWWRNFTTTGPIDILVRRRWMSMAARAIVGADEPKTIAPLLDGYLERFPRAAASLGEGTSEVRTRRAVIVCCRPR